MIVYFSLIETALIGFCEVASHPTVYIPCDSACMGADCNVHKRSRFESKNVA